MSKWHCLRDKKRTEKVRLEETDGLRERSLETQECGRRGTGNERTVEVEEGKMSVRWETEGLQTVGIVCLVIMFLKLMHLLGLIDITETGEATGDGGNEEEQHTEGGVCRDGALIRAGLTLDTKGVRNQVVLCWYGSRLKNDFNQETNVTVNHQIPRNVYERCAIFTQL